MPPTSADRRRASLLLVAPVRPRYFAGRLLTASDLALEQSYHIAARRRLTLLAMGTGVANGLRASLQPGGRVLISPGLAIDRFGREIVVPEAVELRLDTEHGGLRRLV